MRGQSNSVMVCGVEVYGGMVGSRTALRCVISCDSCAAPACNGGASCVRECLRAMQ